MANTVSLTDEMLISLYRDGDTIAMEKLIKKYKPTVEMIAMKYIRSPLEKDDLVQEGMIGLLAAVKSYNNNKKTKFITYANHCVNNSILTALRKFSRMKDIPKSEIVSIEEDFVKTQVGLSAEDEVLAKSSVDILTDLLYENLSSFENEVLKLYITGCSYKEIGNKLGKDAKAIDNAMQRIRKKLNGVLFE